MGFKEITHCVTFHSRGGLRGNKCNSLLSCMAHKDTIRFEPREIRGNNNLLR
jgi:hypothetical protein